MVANIIATAEEVANRRILRLVLGVTLSLVFSQAIGWPLSYIAPVFTLVILGLPIPVPSFKAGFKFVLSLLVPVYAGTLVLIPLLEHARWAGILLVVLALFGSFYYSAHGGSKIMGTFMTMGLTLIIAVGSVSIDALLGVIAGLGLCAISGIAFVWLAYALLPDLPVEPMSRGGAPKPLPSIKTARRSALRSLMVVLPVVIFFLFSSSSTSYIAVMLKVAAMGQQANADISRKMGRFQLESTAWGGLAAVIAWQLMSIWPSLLIYGLLIALAGLLFGPRIFAGKAMHPKASMWSYAFLTMIIVLAPALLDGQTSDGASSAFYSRLGLFIIIAIYGSVSIAVFDAFWPFDQDSSTPSQAEIK
ncbi:MAG: hypothetical protein DRQ35_01935 [Gammaproteobacteria bacterium]|nr:MAG: hypothetical protein DRQ35_01935 [Gammaproteobacteria bacterium]